MRKCKVNRDILCNEQVKTGKGLWMYLDVCAKCHIFKTSQQTQLFSDYKPFKFLCPECLIPNPYKKTPSGVSLCLYCGSLFVTDEGINK